MSVATEAQPAAAPQMNPRTRALLEAPIASTLLRLAWPNMLIMVAQAATGLVETWWVAHLGADALAGMALVFPLVMFMQMMSGGGIGGGISSAIARALGSGRRDDANKLATHAIIINVVLGAIFSAIMLLFGRSIYLSLGATGGALDAALGYSNVVFSGTVLLWLMNGLSSIIRGGGDMLPPALVSCVGVVLLIPLSPLFIFGFGPIPPLGVAGGGVALLVFYAAGTAILLRMVFSARSLARPVKTKPEAAFLNDILSVGGVATLNSLLTNLTIAFATAIVSSAGVAAIAGFGTGARLEYLLVPLAFGLGAPLVAMVGTNIGAGQVERARKIALTGAAIAFVLTEAIGLFAALFPHHWLTLFSGDPTMLETGSLYLRIVGPCYGLFGMGLALYFSSQGAGRLFWPLFAGFARIFIAIGGGWLAFEMTGSLTWFFFAFALGLIAYGAINLAAVFMGAWSRPRR